MTEQTEYLASLFKNQPPCPSQVRFAQAYLKMAIEAHYRPAAPGDGMGGIYLSEDELEDRDLLLKEAVEYAERFGAEDKSNIFRIGCSNYSTNRAFVYSIEAARLLAGGSDSEEFALRMLQMAVKDIKAARASRKSKKLAKGRSRAESIRL